MRSFAIAAFAGIILLSAPAIADDSPPSALPSVQAVENPAVYNHLSQQMFALLARRDYRGATLRYNKMRVDHHDLLVARVAHDLASVHAHTLKRGIHLLLSGYTVVSDGEEAVIDLDQVSASGEIVRGPSPNKGSKFWVALKLTDGCDLNAGQPVTFASVSNGTNGVANFSGSSVVMKNALTLEDLYGDWESRIYHVGERQ